MKRIALLVIFILVGCASVQMNRWVGRTSNELIAEYGEPSAITDESNGGKIYTYSSYNDSPGYEPFSSLSGHWCYVNGKYVYVPKTPENKKARIHIVPNIAFRLFYVDKSGTIYKTDYDRSGW